jgi:hypothetical protein
MERMTPEELEKMVHSALRSLPNRRAPATLEARVRSALEARAALPWWHQSYAHWPLAVRIGFFGLSAALVAFLVYASVLLPNSSDLSANTGALAPLVSWGTRLLAAGRSIIDFVSLVARNLPAVWVYGVGACIVGTYAMLAGLGAAAYRTLWSHR